MFLRTYFSLPNIYTRTTPGVFIPKWIKAFDITLTQVEFVNVKIDDLQWCQYCQWCLLIWFGWLGIKRVEGLIVMNLWSHSWTWPCGIKRRFRPNYWTPGSLKSHSYWNHECLNAMRSDLTDLRREASGFSRLLTVNRIESGAWLCTVPLLLGIHLDTDSFITNFNAFKVVMRRVLLHQCLCRAFVDIKIVITLIDAVHSLGPRVL